MRHKIYLLNFILGLLLVFTGSGTFAQVTISSTDSLGCTTLCTTLNATVIGDTPTDAGVTTDDYYSALHPIGFTFNYYGINYTQCVLGANGTIDFNAGDAGAHDNWMITGPLLGEATKFNNICGPWCDIDIFYGTPTGTETYSTDGVAPFRKFAVTWCGCSMFDCSDQLTTSQIIIYETTNIIEVHIAQKLICTSWNPSSPPGAGGRAIVGVQNATGTAATTAPGRDYPAIWSVPPHEAWRFTPVGGGTSYTVASIPFAPIPYASSAIYWYNAITGAYLGAGPSITVCPSATTTYKAGALGCGADTSFGYFQVTTSGSLAVTTSSTNPTQCGLCDGSITIHGLTPGLIDTINYDLGGVPQPRVIATVSGGGTITISGLCAGVYSGIIATQGLCSSLPATITLTDPGISISNVTTANPTLCGLCNGSIVLHGLYPGHAFTVNYSFNGTPQPAISATTSGAGTITLTGLCAGVYTNIVASFGACITPPVGPYTLTDPPISIITITPSNATACGVCDGKIVLGGLYPLHTFTVTSSFNSVAQPPVSALSSGTGTVTLTGLCAGDYNNIVASFTTTFSTCITPPVGPDTITAPPPPLAFLIASQNPSQCGYCDGSITINAVPPLGADTIYYSLNGVPQPPAVVVALPDSTLHLAGLCVGAYTAFSVKVGPCLRPIVGIATLTTLPIIPSFTQSIHLGCKGDTVFYTNYSTSPGRLYYIWNFGDGVTDTATNPYHIFAQGVYTVTLTATNHICSETMSMQDSLVHPLQAVLIDSPAILCQKNPVTFTDNSIGAGLSYKWYFGNGASASTQNTSYTYNNSGIYKVLHVATDFVPCSDTATAIVQVDSLGPISLVTTDSVLCRSSAVTLTGTFTSIGYTGISWYFGDNDSAKNQNPVFHAYDAIGTFTVTATAHFRACQDIAATKVINLFEAPEVFLGQDTSICPGSEAIILTDRNNADNPLAKWKWNTGQTSPSIEITAPGSYAVDVSINGCHATDTIHVLNDCYMNIPNVFTPNGDGLNDYFYPRQYLTKGLTSFSMNIYNRWGQLVFQTTSLDGAGWDGRLNNVDQPVGVYVYIIDATFKDGQKEHRQGNVTLLR